MRFNVNIELINPSIKDKSDVTLNLVITIAKSGAFNYGNGLCMHIMDKNNKVANEVMDIRYAQLDKNQLELFILNQLYHRWSGENGSWDIKSLTITRDDRYKTDIFD